MKHPMQPIYRDEEGTIRFKENEIVRFLLDHGNLNMNDLARIKCNNNDRSQFAQLIGYSVDGFCDLSYTEKEDCEAALELAKNLP